MRLSLLFLLSLASCSHLTPAFPFSYKECQPVHEFACVNKEPLQRLWCEVHMDAAVTAVNLAAGHTIAARVPYAPGVSPVVVVSAKAFAKLSADPRTTVLGLTEQNHDEETQCLAITPIFLNDILLNDAWMSVWAQTTITHELIHALGGEHSGEGTISIMTPAVSDPLHSVQLSDRDKKTLRNHFN